MAVMSEEFPTQNFARPPYHVEHFPIGSAVCNRDGFNCLGFADKPGAKFTSASEVQTICDAWNEAASGSFVAMADADRELLELAAAKIGDAM